MYSNELDKTGFKRTISHKILKYRAYEIARNFGYHGYQRALASIVYNVLIENTESRLIVNE